MCSSSQFPGDSHFQYRDKSQENSTNRKWNLKSSFHFFSSRTNDNYHPTTLQGFSHCTHNNQYFTTNGERIKPCHRCSSQKASMREIFKSLAGGHLERGFSDKVTCLRKMLCVLSWRTLVNFNQSHTTEMPIYMQMLLKGAIFTKGTTH